jgi:hypothetical protein
MSASQGLNAAYIRGGLIVAACAGVLAQSWLVFAITAVILLGLSLIGSGIRPRRRRR